MICEEGVLMVGGRVWLGVSTRKVEVRGRVKRHGKFAGE